MSTRVCATRELEAAFARAEEALDEIQARSAAARSRGDRAPKPIGDASSAAIRAVMTAARGPAATKPHCRNGHVRTPENTGTRRTEYGDIWRVCRACRRERQRRSQNRKRP